jgi:hypothetical protein
LVVVITGVINKNALGLRRRRDDPAPRLSGSPERRREEVASTEDRLEGAQPVDAGAREREVGVGRPAARDELELRRDRAGVRREVDAGTSWRCIVLASFY